MRKFLVTGAAGFIGMHVAQALLARGDEVVGIDNLNDYYSPQLKQDRLAHLQQQAGAEHWLFFTGGLATLTIALTATLSAHADPAVIFDMGGKFDKSFNEAAYRGAERFRQETGQAYLDFEIANATQEQTQGIVSIHSAMTSLDDVTQQNASLVEESAAAASSLKEQADALAQVVGRFGLAGAA